MITKSNLDAENTPIIRPDDKDLRFAYDDQNNMYYRINLPTAWGEYCFPGVFRDEKSTDLCSEPACMLNDIRQRLLDNTDKLSSYGKSAAFYNVLISR